MKYQFFDIPVQGGAEAQEDFNRFLASHRIASIDREFAADGRLSLWCFCVTYLEGEGAAAPQAKGKIDYREVLSGAVLPVPPTPWKLRMRWRSGGRSARAASKRAMGPSRLVKMRLAAGRAQRERGDMAAFLRRWSGPGLSRQASRQARGCRGWGLWVGQAGDDRGSGCRCVCRGGAWSAQRTRRARRVRCADRRPRQG
ncbi:hypothetical protein THSYN_25525 [Candidatus Thiodictyon syntrophicum]|uniref:Uncharacterized protein n=1 Tax=Candidatus Thiodictyon syntrophicum TaxID=1166950 RepID=A0A2K8UFR7_9GAMM|nr:hypothetical protein THSYN_25525 [Candidatus Thiodictyon syntrophicum]